MAHYGVNSDKFFPIRINSIYPAHPTSFDLYLILRDKYILYLHAGAQLTEDKIKKLDGKGAHFYVTEKDRKAYKEYIFRQLTSDDISTSAKAEILRESSYTLVAELFENPDVHKALEDAKDVVQNLVDFMESEPEGMADLISLSCHDFYTYNHSLDVAIYSLGLGQTAGLNAAELDELGQAALFHDIGKRNVSAEIICKDGPLDEIEWVKMQRHPQFGLKILCEHDNVTEGIKAACFEHHENFLGTGYPQKLKGQDIHPFARIVALTDTYDALTTQRSYNQPMSPKDALRFMKEKLEDRYDPELLNIFHSVLFKIENA